MSAPLPERVADHLAVVNVLHHHSRALDRLQAEQLKDCYWPDAEVDYGSFKGPAHQFAELVVSALEQQYELTRHALSNTLVEWHGDEARVESLIDAAHLLKGGDQEMLFAGRYLDALEYRNNEWKLRHRLVVIDWCRHRDLVNDASSEAFAGMAHGNNSVSDPLHDWRKLP